jgi:hypothetical protein
MPDCMCTSRKWAYPLLPLTQGCAEAVVETASWPYHTPLGLNRSQEHFWPRIPFIIVALRIMPGLGMGQETRHRFLNRPIRACGGNRRGVPRRTCCDGWCRRWLGSS